MMGSFTDSGKAIYEKSKTIDDFVMTMGSGIIMYAGDESQQ
jgi:hypothetical protein